MFSRGFIYRWGDRFKCLGDKVGHVKVRDSFFFCWLSVPLRQIGIFLKRKG